MASKQQQVGSYAFLAGLAVAIIAGLLSGAGQQGLLGGIEVWIPLALVVLGVIVGFMNIKDKEIEKFLIASIVLLVLSGSAGGLSIIPTIGVYLVGIVQNIAVFVAPAALIVAIKSVTTLASEQVI